MLRITKILSVFLTCSIILMSSGIIVFADNDIPNNNETEIVTETPDTADEQIPADVTTDIVDADVSVDADTSPAISSDNVIDSNNAVQDSSVTSDTDLAVSDLDTVNTDQTVPDTNVSDADPLIISEDQESYIVVNDDIDPISSDSSSNDIDLDLDIDLDIDLSESDSNIIFEEEIAPIVLDADDFSLFNSSYGLVNTGSGYHRYSFSGIDSFYFNKIKNHATALAYGSKSDAVMEISLDELGLAGKSWTAEDLGVPYLIMNSQLAPGAEEKLKEMIVGNYPAVITYLLYDLPFDFYWFDKTTGLQIKGYSVGARYNDKREVEIYIKGSVKYYFCVSSDYGNPSTYQVDASKVNRAVQATYNAQAIVDKYSSLSDLEKLYKYKDEICNLVAYDKAAYTNNAAYGDSHQMISVFDGNPNTNVVCEGYSKAFQYLCDLSDFSSDVYCITIGGKMAGVSKAEEHMWNIVHYNGRNYLVDVTNSDGAAAAYSDPLFMKSAVRVVNSDCYTFVCQGKSFNYTYDDDMRSILYTDEALTITTVALGTTTTPASTTTSTPTQKPVAQTTSTPASPSVTTTTSGVFRPTTGTSTGTYRPGTYIPTTGSSTGTYKPTTGTSTGTYRPGTYIPTTGSSTGTYRPGTYIPTTGSSTGTYRPGTYIPTTGSSTGTYRAGTYIPTTGSSTGTYRPGTYIPTTGSSTGTYKPTTGTSTSTYRPGTYIPTTGSSTGTYSPTTVSSVGTYRPATVTTGIYTSYRTGSSNIVFSWDYFVA